MKRIFVRVFGGYIFPFRVCCCSALSSEGEIMGPKKAFLEVAIRVTVSQSGNFHLCKTAAQMQMQAQALESPALIFALLDCTTAMTALTEHA